jgi:hypothetical protein
MDRLEFIADYADDKEKDHDVLDTIHYSTIEISVVSGTRAWRQRPQQVSQPDHHAKTEKENGRQGHDDPGRVTYNARAQFQNAGPQTGS